MNETMQIGGVTLRNRVLLAPMSGVSDLAFRKRAWESGAGAVVSEMIASRQYVQGQSESAKRALYGDMDAPRILQLAGRDPQWMALAAEKAASEGAQLIDINMGCPAKKVIGGLSGSALMREPELALSIIEATVKAVSVPVSVKMRLGWDENSLNAPFIASEAVKLGAAMITVHGRTRMQMYDGTANWDAVRRVRDAIDVPLIVNGDIIDRRTAEDALERSGADAVMVGRATYGAPWACGEIAGIQDGSRPQNLAEYVVTHYREMLDIYGEDAGLRHARKHLGWYLDKHVADAAHWKPLILQNKDVNSVIDQLQQAFNEDRNESRAAA